MKSLIAQFIQLFAEPTVVKQTTIDIGHENQETDVTVAENGYF